VRDSHVWMYRSVGCRAQVRSHKILVRLVHYIAWLIRNSASTAWCHCSVLAGTCVIFCGSAPCARQSRWDVPLRRFVAHRVRSHKGLLHLALHRRPLITTARPLPAVIAVCSRERVCFPVGAHLCATATPGCIAPSVCRAQVRSHKIPLRVAHYSFEWCTTSPA